MKKLSKTFRIGVLAFHGDVSEHIECTKRAGKAISMPLEVFPVRTKAELANLDALIIPGGESPTMQKLSDRAGMWQEIKKVKNIFGTCAGAIMLAKRVSRKTKDQETLGLMDIQVDRNAYGRQTDSFEKNIKTTFGSKNAVFIRAPKIKSVGKNVKVLAQEGDQIFACAQKVSNRYYLATCFHPELSTTVFHEYFLKQII